MLKPFQGLAAEVHTVPIPNHDHRSPESLCALARELGFDASSSASLSAALKKVKRPSRVLVFGSLYLAGHALEANREIPD